MTMWAYREPFREHSATQCVGWRKTEVTGGGCENVDRRTETATYFAKQKKKNKTKTEAGAMEFFSRKAKGALSCNTKDRFTHSMPCPCRSPTMPCRYGFRRCLLPFDLHSAVMSDSHLPCHAHAMLRPCRSSQGHGTARPSKDGLWTTCPRSASSGYHAESHEDCYQKHTNTPHNDPYLRP